MTNTRTHKVLPSKGAQGDVPGHEIIARDYEWLYSKRDAAATAEHLACPWERDNRTFNEQMEAHRALRSLGDTPQADEAAGPFPIAQN